MELILECCHSRNLYYDKLCLWYVLNLQKMYETDCVAEVETLLCHNPAHHDAICPVVHPLVHYSVQSLWKDFMLLNSAIPSITATKGWHVSWQEQLNEYLRQLDFGVQPHSGHSVEKAVVLHGEDISDLPTTYTVENLLPHELPVIGKLILIKV